MGRGVSRLDEGSTEGAFINFPDREVALDQYYGRNYKDLIAVKKKYDLKNLFKFEMGIPLE